MAELVNDDTFRSLEGKSKHQLWLELCDLITKHPKDVADLKVDAILRSGIRKFTDEVRHCSCAMCTPLPLVLLFLSDHQLGALQS